jgi:hypothetical protein
VRAVASNCLNNPQVSLLTQNVAFVAAQDGAKNGHCLGPITAASAVPACAPAECAALDHSNPLVMARETGPRPVGTGLPDGVKAPVIASIVKAETVLER